MEHYSTVYQGTERGVRATLADVDGISPADLLLFSERQYRERDAWNARRSVLHWIPEQFDPRRAIRWTEATDVLTGVKKYLPTGYCYLRYPFKGELECASADSNGCAAGRTLEEAVLSGLSELIERDAVAIWWYNRVARPAVDLASFNEPFLASVRAEWAAEGRDLHVLDVTNDLGMFVYVATAPRMDGSELYFASAAHPDSRTAATKAIGELSQTIYWSTRVPPPPDLGQWLATARLKDHEYFKPAGTVDAVGVQGGRTVEEDVRAGAVRIHAAGIDSYYVDLTRPEINVPVVRVVAPGLRHFWARLGPGRLYDVPSRMGWLDKPNREDDLNPIPCMA
jgi:ribosomal protein S12 methylthiotransferase accessory factor